MRYRIKKGTYDNFIVSFPEYHSAQDISIELKSIAKLNWRKNKILILIDSELKSNDYGNLEGQIRNHLKRAIINDFIIINYSLEAEGLKRFETIDQFIAGFKSHPLNNSIIIIHGKNKNQVKRLTDAMHSNVSETCLEVDLDAITDNLNYYGSTVNPPNKVMAMVKANAYGHGIIEVAHHLKDKVDYFGVAYVHEGIILRKENINTPIMVMNPSHGDFDNCITHNLEPEIYSLNSLIHLNELLNKKKNRLGIHIEIDTGMNRLGIDPTEIDELIKLLKHTKFIQVNGLYSHLACAEDPNEDTFSKKQMNNFNAFAKKIESELGIKTIKHIRNSAGTLRYPESPTNMIRLGIGLYGVDSNKLYQDKLKNVSTLRTVISQIRTVKKGETIGYNRTFNVHREMTIATIAIGYADGFKRLFSNGIGKVIIHGKIVPVVGRVNMDMTMVDITEIEAKEGDEVIVFNEILSPIELATNANTIPYEVFTSIGERVGREYIVESK